MFYKGCFESIYKSEREKSHTIRQRQVYSCMGECSGKVWCSNWEQRYTTGLVTLWNHTTHQHDSNLNLLKSDSKHDSAGQHETRPIPGRNQFTPHMPVWVCVCVHSAVWRPRLAMQAGGSGKPLLPTHLLPSWLTAGLQARLAFRGFKRTNNTACLGRRGNQ